MLSGALNSLIWILILILIVAVVIAVAHGRHEAHAVSASVVQRALDKSKAALAQRMHASGKSASTIANTLV